VVVVGVVVLTVFKVLVAQVVVVREQLTAQKTRVAVVLVQPLYQTVAQTVVQA
jgi:hypothetical protein